jgi:cytochrome c oxidase assembly protein subunit 15
MSYRTYRKITFAAVLALAVIVVSGAGVRLTGSGLGCTEWPKCTETQVHAPLRFHAMIEFGNRVFTGVVSLAVMLAVLGSLWLVPRRRDLTWWSLGLVGGVIAQIVLGKYTVESGLTPQVVAAHFLVSMVLVWNAVVLHRRAAEPAGETRTVVAPKVRYLTHAMLLAASTVLFTGTIVTGTGPHGGDETSKRYDLSLHNVTRIHSVSAWALMALTLAVIWTGYRTRWPAKTRFTSHVLLWCIGVQGSIGYVQYAAGVPEWLVAFHIAGATAVFCATVALWLACREPVATTGSADTGAPVHLSV